MSSSTLVQLPTEAPQNPAVVLWSASVAHINLAPVASMPLGLDAADEDEHLFSVAAEVTSIEITRERLQYLADFFETLSPPAQTQAFAVDAAPDDDDLYPRA